MAIDRALCRFHPVIMKSTKLYKSNKRWPASLFAALPIPHLLLLPALLLIILIAITPWQQSLAGSKAHPLPHNKHCTAVVAVKYNKVFMSEPWIATAKLEARSKWRDKVRERDGSLYAEYHDAAEKKSHCRRIGFGNDPEGNIGTYVACEISARPCAVLVKR